MKFYNGPLYGLTIAKDTWSNDIWRASICASKHASIHRVTIVSIISPIQARCPLQWRIRDQASFKLKDEEALIHCRA